MPLAFFSFAVLCMLVSVVGLTVGVAGTVKALADWSPHVTGALAGLVAGAVFVWLWAWPELRKEFARWERGEETAAAAKRAAAEEEARKQAAW